MIKFGLDFGTTNSSISMAQGNKSIVLPVDMTASDPRVVRSMLYFSAGNSFIGRIFPR